MSSRSRSRDAERLSKAFDQRERREIVWKFRAQGWTIRAISDALKLSKSNVARIVQSQLSELRDMSFESRRDEEFELAASANDQVGVELFKALHGTTGASPGTRIAAGVALFKYIEVKRKMFGLDAPGEMLNVTPTSREESLAMIRERMFALAPSDGPDGAYCTILRHAIANRNILEGRERPEDQTALARGRELYERAVQSLES